MGHGLRTGVFYGSWLKDWKVFMGHGLRTGVFFMGHGLRTGVFLWVMA